MSDNSAPITIRPGFLLQDASTSGGGTHYDRQDKSATPINAGRGVEADYTGRKTVDHEEIVREGNKIVAAARYLLRKHGIFTPIGTFADDQGLAALRSEYPSLIADADAINERATVEGSAHRVRVHFVPIPISVANAEVAAELARTVRLTLEELHTVLRAGGRRTGVDGVERDTIAGAVARCKNLDRLATGIQADSIRFALEIVADRRADLRAALERGESPESAGKGLDLEAIEAAISLFTVAVPDSLAGIA